VLLILKLTIVPLFIGLITIAGRKWGASIAGLLAAFPAASGPIFIFIAYEQGSVFATTTAISGVSGTTCLLIFGLTYSWACIRFKWLKALLLSICTWLALAFLFVFTKPGLIAGTAITIGMLMVMPYLLPPTKAIASPRARLHDLPWRMLAGVMLTLIVTTLAASLGGLWSGILTVFPIISSVVAVFTHITMGANQVAAFYRGMIAGLYSFVAFFIGMAILLNKTSIWTASLISISLSIAIQLAIQLALKMKRV
jgi:hypothetical protein